jgi:hypothetical protein
MKKLVMLATAAFLFSGIAFSQTTQKTTEKAKATKECCKKGDKKCDKAKEAKCCKKAATQKKA